MSETGSETVVLKKDKGIASIFLGRPEEKIAVLTRGRMDSLRGVLQEIALDSGCQGLIITGASASGFCAGANIEEILAIDEAQAGAELARGGQSIFALIEALKLPSIALIRGACVGGGCELVLACNYRLLVDLPATKIGLPEVKLGILPGFGGTQRLPRLIGLPQALEIILKGKTIPAKEAKKVGLADAVYVDDPTKSPEENFLAQLETAKNILRSKKFPQRPGISLGSKLLTWTGIGRGIVRRKVSASLKKETKGHYPAPPLALETTIFGLERGLAAGYEAEAKALGKLAVSPESKSLIHIFRISEASGKLGRSLNVKVSGSQVAVIGAGVMGAGIALSYLLKGANVLLVDTLEAALEKGKGHVESGVAKRRGLTESEKKEIFSRLRVSSKLEDLNGCELVIEAVIEDLTVKKNIFSQLSKSLASTALLASNTSSLSLREIFSGLSHVERFLGIHFFNPAEKMPLVEIIRTNNTGEKELLRAAAFASGIGKYPIVVEDVPGFLVNRILTPYLSESAHLLAQGVSVKAIDDAALRFGMPMGPIRLLDEIGLDVASKVASIIESGYGDRMRSPNFAAALLEKGRKGKKSGRGFYIYGEEGERVEPELQLLLQLPPQPGPEVLAGDTCDRLILSMVNEAVRCLDEGVAAAPGPEAAGQIDLGSVMGLGFAPFRGGVIYYAESLGARALASRLEELAERYGKRFSPCAGISERAARSRSFYQAL